MVSRTKMQFQLLQTNTIMFYVAWMVLRAEYCILRLVPQTFEKRGFIKVSRVLTAETILILQLSKVIRIQAEFS